MSIVFTGDEFADGGNAIINALNKEKIKASFFLTGRFYRNERFAGIVRALKKNGHYLGAHSNDHLLYNDWTKRDSLLLTQTQFTEDLELNYAIMRRFGIEKNDARFFLPPYEWYNDSISVWTKNIGMQLINLSPGTLSAADYTWPALENYRSSRQIMQSITAYEKTSINGLNGFILLLHIGTNPERKDKFYALLPVLLKWLKLKGYSPVRIDELLRSETGRN
jgi:peptidoglycan/xylan/chitin deacetylase (PgdA/CDA1 family)